MAYSRQCTGSSRFSKKLTLSTTLTATVLLTGCFDPGDYGKPALQFAPFTDTQVSTAGPGPKASERRGNADRRANRPLRQPPPLPDAKIFARKSGPEATIRRTTNGVPHIKAKNLESAAFGSGYAQAQDNVCLLAEAFIKARSERTKFFGPGPGEFNVISDFSYKALGIHSRAVEEYDQLSRQSRAMIQGFVWGYNKYVGEQDPSGLPPECRDQPWVRAVDPVDLYAHYRIVAQYASGDLFATGALFLAVPPDTSPAPVIAGMGDGQDHLDDLPQRVVAAAHHRARQRESYTDTGLASNAWGIGKTLTENGRGALLANPHFPYTGPRRFYQSHITVPGVIDMIGGGLIGTPAPLIGFNKKLGWSHTVSTSRRFTLYELELEGGDSLSYVKDGEVRPIEARALEIEAPDGIGGYLTLKRTFYFSEYGPMLAADAVTSGLLPAWGEEGKAYTYRDANEDASGLLDTWLEMSRARNLGQLQATFDNCGSTLWVNTTYADDKGNAYYIDSSSVPNLSPETLAILDEKRNSSLLYAGLFNSGLTLLDGRTSRDDWVEGKCNGRVPFEDMPQLLRDDFVQNSNDSYWATNPAEFLTGYSPLYGPEQTVQSPRTRLGLKMLKNSRDTGYAASSPAGQDGKFGAEDLIKTVYNNRAWYAEQFLGDLRSRCQAIGGDAVNLADGRSRPVERGCDVLAGWDGVYDNDSVGAHVFRVFMGSYLNGLDKKLTVAFDPADPVNTPRGPALVEDPREDPMLQALALGLGKLDEAGVAYDARLGSVQVFQPSGGVPPGGTPVEQGPSFPWHGGDGNVDGAFNAVGVAPDEVAEDTRFPRITSETLADTAGLSANANNAAEPGWLMARGTSWHFGLEFTRSGPEAYGLLSYSQSTDAASPRFNDQHERYSNKDYRRIFFTDREIDANLIPGGEIILRDD